MLLAAKFFALLAALVHALFFCMESLWWLDPQIYQLFGLDAKEALAVELMAFNQGFYNLFLALGMLIAMRAMTKENNGSGFSITAYICCFMIGAATVLYQSAPHLIRGAFVQGVPPLLVLICLFIARTQARLALDEEQLSQGAVPDRSLVNAIVLGRRRLDE